jgi:hypothetical protein
MNHIKHSVSVLGYDCIVVLLVDCFAPKVSVKRRPFCSLLALGFQRVGQDSLSQVEIAGDGIFRVGLSGEGSTCIGDEDPPDVPTRVVLANLQVLNTAGLSRHSNQLSSVAHGLNE